MSEHVFTRRNFLAGSAGAVALAAASGAVSFNAWEQAVAASDSGGETYTAHTLCGGCSGECGYTAYIRNGKLVRQDPDEAHPCAQGMLCACGLGYANIAWSEDRLTEPLKKNSQGKFEKISWDQAIDEIAEKAKSIVDHSGPEALALVHGPGPSGAFYGPRFMNALGSANVYVDGATCDLSRASGFNQVIGSSGWISDVRHSKMTMFLGAGPSGTLLPGGIQELRKARENGAYIVVVDPRYSSAMALADEWVPINPGTELAFLLAMAYEVVKNGAYDSAFVAKNVEGFDEWRASLAGYTIDWAEPITGVKGDVIARLAARMAESAPAASIEQGWHAACGSAYANSGETARMIAIFNSLLGCWNQEGGALLTADVTPDEIDEKKFTPVPKPKAEPVGADKYPLAHSGLGASLACIEAAEEGDIKGMFFYGSNMVAEGSNPERLGKCLDGLELCVVVDSMMTETAQHASYILPECSFLERLELPEFVNGIAPAVTLRDKVIDVQHPDTKPVDEIFTALAQACGVGKYFDFTLEELASALAESVGASLDDLRRTGTVALPDQAFKYGTPPAFGTSDGRVHFTSEACLKAGYSAAPQWVEPLTMPRDNLLRVIGGRQAPLSGTQTADEASLAAIAKQYGLESAWINTTVAKQLDIDDGDTIEVSGDYHKGNVRAHVTDRINPTAIFLPSSYGCTVEEQKNAYHVGLRQMDFAPFALERGYGGACMQEALVSVKKVNA